MCESWRSSLQPSRLLLLLLLLLLPPEMVMANMLHLSSSIPRRGIQKNSKYDINYNKQEVAPGAFLFLL